MAQGSKYQRSIHLEIYSLDFKKTLLKDYITGDNQIDAVDAYAGAVDATNRPPGWSHPK